MKRCVYSIHAIVLALLCTASAFASTDEATAPWEKELDGKIWSERVLDSGNDLYGNEDAMPLNASCDASAFERLGSDRSRYSEILITAIENGAVDEGTRLCANLLNRAGAVGVTKLSSLERDMVNAVSITGSTFRPFNDSLRRRERGGQFKDVCMAASTPGNAGNASGKTVKTAAAHKRIDTLCNKVNLADYSTDYSMVDYFSLILYQWEGIPLDGTLDIPFSRLECLFRRTSCVSPPYKINRNQPQNIEPPRCAFTTPLLPPLRKLRKGGDAHSPLIFDPIYHPIRDSRSCSRLAYCKVIKSERFHGGTA